MNAVRIRIFPWVFSLDEEVVSGMSVERDKYMSKCKRNLLHFL